FLKMASLRSLTEKPTPAITASSATQGSWHAKVRPPLLRSDKLLIVISLEGTDAHGHDYRCRPRPSFFSPDAHPGASPQPHHTVAVDCTRRRMRRRHRGFAYHG